MYDIFTLPAPQPRVLLWHGTTKMTTLADKTPIKRAYINLYTSTVARRAFATANPTS